MKKNDFFKDFGTFYRYYFLQKRIKLSHQCCFECLYGFNGTFPSKCSIKINKCAKLKEIIACKPWFFCKNTHFRFLKGINFVPNVFNHLKWCNIMKFHTFTWNTRIFMFARNPTEKKENFQKINFDTINTDFYTFCEILRHI